MYSMLLQTVVGVVVLTCLVPPIGSWIAHACAEEPVGLWKRLRLIEQRWMRRLGIDTVTEMTSGLYAKSVIVFSLFSILFVLVVQCVQAWLPWNPESLPNVSFALALNTAVSFATNTNWQAYSGESTMSYGTQMIALTSQNFLSAAVGIAVLLACVRGLTRTQSPTIGNFYGDVVRSVLYILLPASAILALALVSQGVVQSLAPYPDFQSWEEYHAKLSEDTISPDGDQSETNGVKSKRLAIGPAASQVAIKQLGTNGGGFFGTNSAHPFENPTSVSNFLQWAAILLIPAALCLSYGHLVRDKRQGWALLATMCLIFVPLTVAEVALEQGGNPKLPIQLVDQSMSESQAGGNMEGKETRFGIFQSAIWATATTAASNGSVNAMHDSFTPLGGLIPMFFMQLGEVIFGGVGSGLYGMFMFVLVAVFVAGLLVGRTPEYLGKKIGAKEMKLASISILLPCACVLVGTAIAVSIPSAQKAALNPGPHGFSEILYAVSSASNNNGSAFGGLGANTTFYNLLLAVAMLIGRFGVILPVLGIAGTLAAKNRTPPSPGTLPTHSPLFVIFLMAIILLVGALSFLPALALGPVVEQLIMAAGQ